MSTVIIDVQAPVALTFQVGRGTPWLVEFEVANRRIMPVAGTVVLKDGERTITRRPVSIAARGKETVRVDLRQDGKGSPNAAKLLVEFVDSAGSRSRFPGPLAKSMLSAVLTPRPPVIDGRLDEWKYELFFGLQDAANQKLSGELQLLAGAQYDATNLYLAFKLHDRSHVQERSPADSWQEDSIQIGLALNFTAGAWQYWQKICLFLNSQTGQVGGYRHMGNFLPNTELRPGEMTWAVRHEGEETFYEVALPWSMLGKGVVGPPVDGFMGLGVMVNNVDRDFATALPTRRECIDPLGGMGWSRPEEFGILELK